MKMERYILSFLLCISMGMTYGQDYALDSTFIRLTQVGEGEMSLRWEMKINTKLWEFSPTFYKHGIVYVGSRADKKLLDFDNHTPFFTIRFAELNKNGELTLPTSFGVRNSPEMHEGPLEFTADYEYMYYTKSVPVKGERKVPLQIYLARRGEEHWVDVGPLSFEDSTRSYAHPTLNKSGDELVFSAELEDSYGGMDLYLSKKLNGQWSEPVNLGPEVNSRGNEVFPRFHPSGVLCYASDGLGRGQDLDMYATIKRGGVYSIPMRLKEPFNSGGDDFGIIFDENGRQGYFNSNRKGTEGEDDIISFTSSIPLFPYGNRIKQLQLVVEDKVSRKRLNDVSIYLLKLDNKGLVADKSFYKSEVKTEGEEVHIVLKLKDPGQFPLSQFHTDINGIEDLEYSTSHPFLLIASKPGYRVKQIYLDSFDTDKLKIQLEFIECIPLEIVTVNKAHKRITSHLRIINECNGQTIPSKGMTIGKFSACLQPDCYYSLIMTGTGYVKDTLIFRAPQSMDDSLHKVVMLQSTTLMEETSEELPEREETSIAEVSDLETGDVITLRKIYYDFNKSSIRTGAADELEALAVLLKKYPELRIELDAHTDSRGSATYNLELSLQRAESAKLFLVNKGINPNRIIAVGYGESIPLNKCVDGVPCTEEEYQYNRRTQVRILSAPNLDVKEADNAPDRIDKAEKYIQN